MIGKNLYIRRSKLKGERNIEKLLSIAFIVAFNCHAYGSQNDISAHPVDNPLVIKFAYMDMDTADADTQALIQIV